MYEKVNENKKINKERNKSKLYIITCYAIIYASMYIYTL